MADASARVGPAERPCVYRLMADDVLARAVADLERTLSAMDARPACVALALRCAYAEALDRARAEQERRRV